VYQIDMKIWQAAAASNRDFMGRLVWLWW